MVEAFKNLVISLNLAIKSEEDFERYFETLCGFIKLQNEDEDVKPCLDIIDEIQKNRL